MPSAAPASPTTDTADVPRDVVWQGDCLDVLRRLSGECVDAVVTDPPYGIDYQSARRTDRAQRKPKIANDRRPFIWWLYDAFRVTREGGALICFCEWRHQEVFRLAIELAGYTVRSQVIWDREWHGLGDLNAAFAPQHDVIWFATKGRFAFPNGRPKSIIRARRLAAEALTHPNEKPVALMRTLVAAVSREGDVVLDPFAGSGATLRACQASKRHWIGIEQNPQYVTQARAWLDTPLTRDARMKAPRPPVNCMPATITPLPTLWDVSA